MRLLFNDSWFILNRPWKMFSEGATCKLSTISKWFTESDSNCWICYFKWFITNNQYIRVIFHWHSTQVCIRCYLTKLNMDAHKAFPLVTNWEQIINYYCTFFAAFVTILVAVWIPDAAHFIEEGTFCLSILTAFVTEPTDGNQSLSQWC